MRAGVMGMEGRTDKDRRDKESDDDPAQCKFFHLSFCLREKKEQRVDAEEIPVGQSSSSSRIIIRHEHNISQYFSKCSQEDEPLKQFLLLDEEKDEKEESREEIPGDSCESSKEVVKKIKGNKLSRQQMLLCIAVCGHLDCLDRIKGYILLFEGIGVVKALSFSPLIVPVTGDDVIGSPEDSRGNEENKDDEKGFEDFFLKESQKHEGSEEHNIRRFGKGYYANEEASKIVCPIRKKKGMEFSRPFIQLVRFSNFVLVQPEEEDGEGQEEVEKIRRDPKIIDPGNRGKQEGKDHEKGQGGGVGT